MTFSNKFSKKTSLYAMLLEKQHRIILASMILLSSIVISSFITYINSELKHVELQHFEELQLVGKLKVKQINRWLSEHEKHLTVLKSSQSLANLLNNPTKHSHLLIKKKLRLYQKNLGLADLIIQDKQGNIVSSLGAKYRSDEILSKTISQALLTNRIKNTGLYRTTIKNKEYINFNFVTSLGNEKEFVIIMSVDKDEFLFPFLQKWPNQSTSAETLLFKETQQGVLFLNELRHEKDTAVKRTALKENEDVLAIQVINKQVISDTYISGIDYRDESVIGVSLYLPKFDWYLLAKMDKSEVYQDFYAVILWQLLGIIFTLSSIFAVSLILIQRKVLQQATIRERDLAESSLDVIFKVVPDLYFRLSSSGVIVDYRAQKSDDLYTSPNDFIGKKMQDILPQSTSAVFDQKIKELFTSHSMVTFEYELNTNKITHWFEARMSLTPEQSIIIIVRNITEQKKSHQALVRANSVIKNSRVVLFRWKLGKNWDVELVSENIKLFGYTQEDLLSGKLSYSAIIHPDDIDKAIEEVAFYSAGKVDDFKQEYRIVSPSGKIFWTEDRTQIIRDKSGNVLYYQGTVIDKTEQKMLAKQVSYYNRLFESSLNEIYIFNGDSLRFIDVNHGALNNIGYTLTEIKKLTTLEIIPPSTQELFLKSIKSFQNKTQKKLTVTTTHQRKDGSTYPVEAHVELIDEESNSYIALVHDITERADSLKVIKQSAQKLTDITNSVNDAIVMINEDGRIVFWNTGAENIFDCSFKNANNKNVFDLLFPIRNKKYYHRCYSSLTRSNKSAIFNTSIEIIALKKQQFEIDVELSLSSLASDNQRFIIGVFRDVSKRKKMEQKLLKLAQAVEQSPESIVITNLKGDIEYVNKSFTTKTGFKTSDVYGKNPKILQSGNTPQKTYEDMWQTLGQGNTWTGELYNKRKNGEEYIEFAIITPLRQPDGVITHYVAVKEDITERKAQGLELDIYRDHLESLVESRTRELTQAKKVAVKASKAKSIFLANMSHEIRTPMNAIIGLTHILSRTKINKTQRDQLKKIDLSAGHLLSIINDILDLSKIESGKFILECTDFSLHKVFENLEDMLTEQAKNKGLTITFSLTDVPVWVKGDITRVQHALMNYLTNAIKFSTQGDIEVRTKLLEKNEDELLIEFSVTDQGCGVHQDNIDNIFKVFQQADTSTTRKFGGSGLGLTITKQLAQLMNGQVGVESKLGEGSKFWFSAQLQVGEEKLSNDSKISEIHSEQLLRTSYQGANILVVEDNEINAEVAQLLLVSVGLNVDIARNGQEALEKINNKTFDLVLMDIQMPVLDGLQATTQIRLIEGNDSLPILAMSANAFNEDRQACINVGMNDFVAKPVSPRNLFSALLKWLPVKQYSHTAMLGSDQINNLISHNSDTSTDTDKNILNSLQNITLLEADNGLKNCAGNIKSYLTLLSKFDDMQVDALAKIKDQLANNSFDELKQSLHALKGTSGNLGLETTFKEIQLIEIRLNNIIENGTLNNKVGLLTTLDRDLQHFSSDFQMIDFTRYTHNKIEMNPANITEALENLCLLLSKDNADANTYFDTIADEFINTYGTQAEAIKNHINNFDYLLALEAISSLSDVTDKVKE